jgi:hypothetical protein
MGFTIRKRSKQRKKVGKLFRGPRFEIVNLHGKGEILVSIDSNCGLGHGEGNTFTAPPALRKDAVSDREHLMRQAMLVMSNCINPGDRYSIARSKRPTVHNARFPPEQNTSLLNCLC